MIEVLLQQSFKLRRWSEFLKQARHFAAEEKFVIYYLRTMQNYENTAHSSVNVCKKDA